LVFRGVYGSGIGTAKRCIGADVIQLVASFEREVNDIRGARYVDVEHPGPIARIKRDKCCTMINLSNAFERLFQCKEISDIGFNPLNPGMIEKRGGNSGRVAPYSAYIDS